MHYGQIFKCDSANGEGIRLSLFVSGCTNCCKGCFQPETWDFHYGRPYTKETEEFLLKELSLPYYDGLSILGGEPFEPSNQEVLLGLLRKVLRHYPEKTIWMYTGFVYERDLLPGGRKHTLQTDELLDSIHILVDGPFQEEKKSLMLRFRGSANQRIIDMPATRREGRVILSPLHQG